MGNEQPKSPIASDNPRGTIADRGDVIIKQGRKRLVLTPEQSLEVLGAIIDWGVYGNGRDMLVDVSE